MSPLSTHVHVLFFFLFLCQEPTTHGQNIEVCKSSRCNQNGPEIKFPFRLNTEPSSCGLDEFQLSCSIDQNTLLHLPLSGTYHVTQINYLHKTITIMDSNDTKCPIHTLLSLNLSASTFTVPTVFQTFAIVNCAESVSWTGAIGPISCMSGQNNFVYIVDAYSSIDKLPHSCSSSAYSEAKISTDLGLRKGVERLLEKKEIRIGWEYDNGCRACELLGNSCVGFNRTTNSTRCYGFNKPQGSSHTPPIIGLTIGGTIVVVVVVLIFSYRIRKSLREKETEKKIEKFLTDYKNQSPIRYTYNDIKKMTDKFEHKLGQGGHGSVFRGKLLNGVPIAVKVLKNSKDGNEFMNEIATISRIHHFNVVRLLGYCSEATRRALVYEYMPNESLQRLMMSKEGRALEWEKIESIANGIARGIEYLHQGCNRRILHFDIKPHNVLLDGNLQPKLSDFGMAKLCSKEESGVVVMNVARGTEGYMAPEVLSRNFGEVSDKADVYSFGMLLVEIVEKRLGFGGENEEQICLSERIYNRVSERKEIEGEEEIAKKLGIVGLWCIQWNPIERPSMSMVIQMLEGDSKFLEMPPKPFVSSDIEMGAS